MEPIALHCIIWEMIDTFRHKGLKLFYERGDTSRLQPRHISKIRLILTRLDAVTMPEEKRTRLWVASA